MIIWPNGNSLANVAIVHGEPGATEMALRLAILLSGSGTTLQNLIDQISAQRLAAQIVQVISNKPDVLGVERARQANLPVTILNRKSFASVATFSDALFAQCRESQAELVCMAGFLQLIQIPEDFQHRVMNIHPSLLPAFGGQGMYGHHVHEAVLEYGAKVSGCTVHFADNQLDHGPIILQRAIAVFDDDTAETLAARVFQEECLAYPEAIQLFAENRIQIQGRIVLKR